MRRSSLLPLACAGLLLAASPPQDDTLPHPAKLLRTWEDLGKSKRKKVVKAFLTRMEELETPQLEIVRELCEDAGKAARPPRKPPHFDPKEHVRNQPIRRKALETDDEEYVFLAERLFAGQDERRLIPSYVYDWYTREVTLVGDPEDPDTVFQNAVHGHPPGLDLARAHALATLDRGQEEELMRAFAHSYTDREGNLFPGITLYDAWASGQAMEMPDIDTLGLVHTLLDDWETWTDPVEGSKQESLYETIGELFGRARRFREPRESAVDNLLIADPVPRPGYDSLHGNFQALWAEHASDVGALAERFPGAEDWRPWIEDWVDTCKTSAEVWNKGLAREKELAESADAVRLALVEALREAKVLD